MAASQAPKTENRNATDEPFSPPPIPHPRCAGRSPALHLADLRRCARPVASGAYYTAELAAPAKDAKVIGGGVVWRCEGTSCVAPKGSSAPATMCKKLAREVGTIASFTAKGEALAEDKLAKCNA
jgi:hypothetical protein